MLKIYGITYGDKKTEFTEYKNTATERLWRFEYNPMIDIVDNHIGELNDSDYLGIFSWKFRDKTRINKPQLNALFLSAIEVDCYNLSPNLGNNIGGCGCFMDWSAKGHGEALRDLIKECCEHVLIEYNNNPSQIIYANQFIMRVGLYKQYMNMVIKPCLELLEGKLWHIANQPANYSAGLELKKLKESTGLDFYNYIPFVLERMTMQYINNLQIKTVQLI